MDALAHAVIGLTVAGLSGHQPAVGDPVYIATILGAQAPDFDLVAQIKGDMSYLKQHRAFSHSIPGIMFSAILISFALSHLSPNITFGQAFMWAFAGGLSHIIVDYFNTHGVAILWPFCRERKSYPLLNVFDPLALIIMLAPYGLRHLPVNAPALALAGLNIYIAVRFTLRLLAESRLRNLYKARQLQRLWVMPALESLTYWDFVAETKEHYINGQLRLLAFQPQIRAALPKAACSDLTSQAEKTSLGQFFRTFTPYAYFEEHPESYPHTVNIYDLRYFSGKQFIHSATVVFNQDDSPCETYIHSLGRTIKLQPAG